MLETTVYVWHHIHELKVWSNESQPSLKLTWCHVLVKNSSTWPTTDLKRKMSSCTELNLRAIICAQKQVWCSDQPLVSPAEEGGQDNSADLIIGLVAYTSHMSSLAKECTLGIHSHTPRDTQFLYNVYTAERLKTTRRPLLTLARVLFVESFPAVSDTYATCRRILQNVC